MFMRLPKVIAVGIYQFKCFNSNNKSVEFMVTETFKIYGNRVVVADILPKRIPVNTTVNVTVIGNGFTDTSKFCIFTGSWSKSFLC